MAIGDRIKIRREELGLTQQQLADRLGYKSKSAINKIEMGINDVAQKKVPFFAKALETSIEYLMEMDDAVEKNEQPKYYTDPVTAEIVEAMSMNPKLKALFHAQRHMDDTEVIAATAFYNAMIAEKQKEERLDQDDPC